jgi:hypothetical protein
VRAALSSNIRDMNLLLIKATTNTGTILCKQVYFSHHKMHNILRKSTIIDPTSGKKFDSSFLIFGDTRHTDLVSECTAYIGISKQGTYGAN